MDKHRPNEDTASVLGLAIALWGGAVSIGAVEGVFARLSPGTLAALAAFALAYAPAMVTLDRSLHEFVVRVDARVLGAALAAFTALAVALGIGSEGSGLARLGDGSGAIAALFAAPMATALAVAGIGRALAGPSTPKSAAAKSPGATPAAT